MTLIKNLKGSYSPLYFLASLGSGGLAITFFMYLVFMTPHKDFPIPNFETLVASFYDGGILGGLTSTSTVLINIVTILSIIAIIYFTYLHFKLLFWNIKEYKIFKDSDNYNTLTSTNAEIQLMAIPLTLGMTINVLFIVGALFVPKLWSVVEYLFPLAVIGFAIVGFFAVKIFIIYSTRVLSNGSFDNTKNNNLSQMLGVFTFAMVGVGFAASAAMSHNTTTSGIAIVLSILFLSATVIFGIIKIVIGFHSMLEHGTDQEASVSLWIVIPIMTLIGIAVYRIIMGMHHNFGTQTDGISHLVWFSIVISIQLVFGLIGYAVMKNTGYFSKYLHGEEKSIASYALVCPGVAAAVLGFFFIHKGLISAGVLSQYSIWYFLLLIPVVLMQFKTISVMFKLNKKLINK